MPNPLASAIAITWSRNGSYAQRLVGDLADDQFLAQPVPGRVLNHPAWILSHLLIYKVIAVQLLRRQSFPDPIDDPRGPKSEPVADPAAYPPPQQLVARFREAHDEAARVLADAGDDAFALSNPIERWRTVHPTVGDMLVTLMVKHESHHLGQLSTWRRALGLPSVAM